MAVAYATVIAGTTSSSSATAAISFAGRSAGQFALVCISRSAVVAPSAVPTNWNLLDSHMSTYGIWLYWKILESGDIGTVTWTWAAATKTLQAATVYTGVATSTPAYTKGTYITGSGRTLNLGSLTVSGGWITVIASCYSTASKTFDFAGWTPAWTERRDAGGTAPDFWQVFADTNGGWPGGEFRPSLVTGDAMGMSGFSGVTEMNYVSAAATYRGGFIVELLAA